MIKSRRLRWAKYAVRMEGKPTGKRPQGRPRPRWDDNIRLDLKDLKKMCGNTRNCIVSDQDRCCWRGLVYVTLKFRFHRP